MKANHLALAGLIVLSVLLTQALSRTPSQPIGTLNYPKSLLDDAQAKVEPSPPVGKRVTVHLRKDALGMATSFATSPIQDTVGNIELSLTGTLEDINEDWLVLELNTGKYWVARESILLVATDQ